jgi:DNA-binding MarR family transcriptional regulator
MAKKIQPLRIGGLVHDVSRLRRTVFDQRVKPLGLTRSQWWVLAGLSRHHGKAMTQTELALMLDVGKVSLGGLVDRLEEKGFIVREADETDRRSKRVSVSPKGRALARRMDSIAADMKAQTMCGISHAQQKQLAELLNIMKRNLQRLDAMSDRETVGDESGTPARKRADGV